MTHSDLGLGFVPGTAVAELARAWEGKARKSEHKKTITVNRLIALREKRGKSPLCRDVFGFICLGLNVLLLKSYEKVTHIQVSARAQLHFSLRNGVIFGLEIGLFGDF